jgi:hypothetical protein
MFNLKERKTYAGQKSISKIVKNNLFFMVIPAVAAEKMSSAGPWAIDASVALTEFLATRAEDI